MTARKTSNQELRTRKDLLQAAQRLMQAGKLPSMEEVAREALVSRATAYRYFRSVDAILLEAPVDAMVKDPEEVFGEVASDDPVERIEIAETSMHAATFQNEAQLRRMLARAVVQDTDDESAPRRQNRRVPLIEAALAPGRDLFGDATYDKLVGALALVFGIESMIVCRDVLRIDEPAAAAMKSWAVRALVRAALEESD